VTDRALWAGLRIVAVGISVAWILIAILDAALWVAVSKGAAFAVAFLVIGADGFLLLLVAGVRLEEPADGRAP
jgi:hypothetical protein